MEGIQVFTATKAMEREGLGERVTEWLREEPPKEILDMQITQSSDDEYHCLAVSALTMVSCVVKLFDAIIKKVVAGFSFSSVSLIWFSSMFDT